jgi:uncharacterized membrane protein YbaN (DUF454 family)
MVPRAPSTPRPPPGRTLPGRVLLAATGTLALAVGIVGIVVPLLPTTPLVLVAAACYARAWPAAHRWLERSRHFGPILRSGDEGRYLPARAKAVAVLLTAATFTATILLVGRGWALRAGLAALGLVVIGWLLALPTSPRPGPPRPGE